MTYERKPYSELRATAFRPTTICGDEVGLHESRLRNLGRGRGRLRRIVVRTEDGRQISFLASLKLPADELVAILWNRWRQENGFKDGNERWGINQLDGRRVEPYSERNDRGIATAAIRSTKQTPRPSLPCGTLIWKARCRWR